MGSVKTEEFNRKVFFGHLILTFVIMGICWGLCIILGINGMTMKDHAWIYIPWFVGGISPAAASFAVLKKNGEIAGFKDWVRHVFDFKHGVWLCVLCHAIINSVGNFFHYDMYGSYLASGITAGVMILASLILVFWKGRRINRSINTKV